MKANREWRKRCVAEARCKARDDEVDELKRLLRDARQETKKTLVFTATLLCWGIENLI